MELCFGDGGLFRIDDLVESYESDIEYTDVGDPDVEICHGSLLLNDNEDTVIDAQGSLLKKTRKGSVLALEDIKRQSKSKPHSKNTVIIPHSLNLGKQSPTNNNHLSNTSTTLKNSNIFSCCAIS